jgi:hypothetical protein
MAVTASAVLLFACGDGGAGGSGGSGGAGTGGTVATSGAGGGVGTGGLALGTGGSAVVDAAGTAASVDVGPSPGIDTGSDAPSCSPGVDPLDCQLCQGDLPAWCGRACPKVDCSVYPPPAECAAVCAGASCCSCQRSFGNEYFWRAAAAPKCGTVCTDLVAKWNAAIAGPAFTACTADSDCVAVGGGGSCQCVASLSGCGKAVNRTAYQSSGAGAIALEFFPTCDATPSTWACDCGLPIVGCKSGQCVITGYVGCSIGIDAGLPFGG